MIKVEGLTKRYGNLVALRDVSFEVAEGEVVGLLGPNGAGKTTAMRVLTGYLPATAGHVTIAGHALDREATAARRAVGYLPEVPPLYPEMRVADYVRYVAALNDVPRRERARKVEHALEVCGLEEVPGRVIRTLSKGFRQRVGLAQALVHDPPVLVLDEPTSGLDPVQISEIRALILSLSEERGRTIILSTHLLPEVEAICQRVMIIAYGQMRLDSPLSEVHEQGTLEQVFLQKVEAAGAALGGGEARA
ncbi:MAG: ABC transporter ATP-binding protein [Myxococcota bacterium]